MFALLKGRKSQLVRGERTRCCFAVDINAFDDHVMHIIFACYSESMHARGFPSVILEPSI